MRAFLAVLVAAALLVAWALLDRPTAAEQALAERTAVAMAQASGPLPPQTGPDRAVPGKAYAFRAARHGLVVFVTYGMTSGRDRALVRAAARQALAADPALQAVSVESYDTSAANGRARFFARETVER